MSYEMESYIDSSTEYCVQEKFWMPTTVEEGQFLQLGCGCIKQSVVGTVAHYCSYHRTWESIYFVGMWRTIYNKTYVLYDGPVTAHTYVTLQEKLGINLPYIGFF